MACRDFQPVISTFCDEPDTRPGHCLVYLLNYNFGSEIKQVNYDIFQNKKPGKQSRLEMKWAE